MKNIFLIAMFFILIFSGLRAEDLLIAQVSENGNISVVDASEKPIANIQLQISTTENESLPFDPQIDSRFNAICTLPHGEQIGLASEISISGSTLHVRYKLTALNTIQISKVFGLMLLPYQDWVGAPFQLGQSQGSIPSPNSGEGLLTKPDISPLFSLGPDKQTGLTLQANQTGLCSALLGSGNYLVLGYSHGEPSDKPWLWRAGEEKIFDFNITFNRNFASRPTQSRKASKDLSGFWYAKIKSSDDLDRNDRLVLQVKKEKSEVYIHDLDMPSGGENILLKKVSWKGKKINAENKFLILNLSLNSSDVFLSGDVKTMPDGKIYPVSFSRGLDYTLPRVDADDIAVTEYTYQLPQTLSDGWPIGDLRNSPFDSNIIQKGVDEILTQQFPNIESLVLVKNGQLILDEYFKGMGSEDSHQLQSATKSILSILFGIAQDQGLVNVNDKLYDYFPEYRNKPGWDPKKDKITLGTLLSMTSGYACDDFVPATDCHFEMYKSPDWLNFVLSQPMNHEPGEHWAYCNDCIELLGAVIARKSGMSIPDFAQKYLYDPLGIKAHQWETGPHQVTEVCGSHRLRPRDMAKLGYLYLKKGNWNGKQIVSVKWVEESTKPYVPRPVWNGQDYGYLWWVAQMPFKDKKIRVFYAGGLGGQNIFVVPDLDLVCVLTAANYKFNWDPSMEFFKTYILGALK